MKRALVIGLLVIPLLAAEKQVLTIHVLRSHLDFHGALSQDCDQKGSRQSCELNRDQVGHTATITAEMPDGSRAVLLCDSRVNAFVVTTTRACTDLAAGDYPAEIKGSKVWITVDLPAEKQKYGPDGKLLPRKTRPERVKYEIITAEPAEKP